MAYTAQHLKDLFLASTNMPHTNLNPADPVGVQAAVLIPILEVANKLNILFTQRTQHLTHHAGQICFPGGRREDADSNLAMTALREVEEEIGIAAYQIDVIAQLKTEPSSSGFLVTPFLGMLIPPYQLKPDPYEVATIFEVPFEYFMQAQNYYIKKIVINKTAQQVYFIEFKGKLIWGLTAKILFNLMQIITLKK